MSCKTVLRGSDYRANTLEEIDFEGSMQRKLTVPNAGWLLLRGGAASRSGSAVGPAGGAAEMCLNLANIAKNNLQSRQFNIKYNRCNYVY